MMMALVGICCSSPTPECVEFASCFSFINSSKKPDYFLPRINGRFDYYNNCYYRIGYLRTRSKFRWSSVSRPQTAAPPEEFEEDGSATTAFIASSAGGVVCDESSVAVVEEDDNDFSHVIKFKMCDFKITDRVSVGLTSRADEVIFEAAVKDVNSTLYGTKVVLRRLISIQAKRRGRRAIEVLKRLARRKLMLHSYSMQVYGYVCSSTTGDSGSFTLVHGYHGSFSLRHWLQQSDWLPTLEATLALDEESARKVGDDTVGGPAVSRQLRIIRILMRDLLIGVNYLHSHGLAHTELRLENLHISPVDKHIKWTFLCTYTLSHKDFGKANYSVLLNSGLKK